MCIAEAQRAGVSGELIRRAKLRTREWKRELHRNELDAELTKFTPVLELANPVDDRGRPIDDEFDALLMELSRSSRTKWRGIRCAGWRWVGLTRW